MKTRARSTRVRSDNSKRSGRALADAAPWWNLPAAGPSGSTARRRRRHRKQVTSGPVEAGRSDRVRATVAPTRLRDRRCEGGRPLRFRRRRPELKRMNDDRHLGVWVVLAGVGYDLKNADTVYACDVALYRSPTERRSSCSRAFGRGRLPPPLDRPRRSAPHDRGLRSGRCRHRRRRHDVELVVQPADRAVLPCRDRRQVPVLDLRRAAGQRRGGDAGANGLSLDHAAGLERDLRRRRERLHPSRSHGPRHRLGRQGRAVRLAHAQVRRPTRPPGRLPPGSGRSRSRVLQPQAIYFGRQFVFKTVDGGRHWEKASPDHARIPTFRGTSTPEPRDSDVKGPRRVVYAIALSPLADGRIWSGTDDGLIWLSRDDGELGERRAQGARPGRRSGHRASHSTRERPPRSIGISSTTSPRSSFNQGRGKTWRRSPAGCRAGAVNVVREDPSARACCTPGPRPACSCRSTTATIGSRCSSTCRTARSATSTCATATSSSARTVARSGSWTTYRLYGSSTRSPRVPSSSSSPRVRSRAFARRPSREAPSRRMSRWRRTRRAAPSSTTS